MINQYSIAINIISVVFHLSFYVAFAAFSISSITTLPFMFLFITNIEGDSSFRHNSSYAFYVYLSGKQSKRKKNGNLFTLNQLWFFLSKIEEAFTSYTFYNRFLYVNKENNATNSVDYFAILPIFYNCIKVP